MSDLNSYFLVSQLFQVYCPKVAVSPTLLLKTAFIYTSVYSICVLPRKLRCNPKISPVRNKKKENIKLKLLCFFGCMCPLEQLFRLYRGLYYPFIWVHNERFVRISTWNVTGGCLVSWLHRIDGKSCKADLCTASGFPMRSRSSWLASTGAQFGCDSWEAWEVTQGIHRGKTAISQDKFSEMWKITSELWLKCGKFPAEILRIHRNPRQVRPHPTVTVP